MQFRVDQRFEATVEAVLDLYTDPSFYDSLVGLPKIGTPEVLSCDRTGDEVRLRVRYRFTGDLPGAALAVLDPAKLTWVEDSRFHLAEHRASTDLLPDHYADRLVASATSVYAASEPHASVVTVRRIQGDLRVRMPFVGGQVEKAIVSGLREHLVAEEQVAVRQLAARA